MTNLKLATVLMVGCLALAFRQSAYADDRAMPDLATARETIIAHCVKEEPSNYAMRLACIEVEFNAIQKLLDMPPKSANSAPSP